MISDQNIREQVLDTTQSFLVQAPAGSGKTSLLVQRFLSLLVEVEQAPEEILALTFTRKAAAEMRDRIIDSLQLGLQDLAPTNEYEHKLWLLAKRVLQRDQQAVWNLLDNPARLKIQTIDALCSNITAQMPIMTQFGAQPQIESKPEVLYQKAVNQLLQESTNQAPWQQDLNILLAYLDNDRIKLNKLLVSMLAVRDQWLPTIIKHLSQNDILSSLESSLEMVVEEAMVSLIAIIPAELNFSLLTMQEPVTINDWLIIAERLLTNDDNWRRRLTEAEGFPSPSKAPKDQRELLKTRKNSAILMLEKLNSQELFRQRLAALRKLPPTTYTAEQSQILNALAIILRVLVAQLILVFKENGQVDFCQVSLSALHALGDQEPPSELALALDCKIRHILVDEFQDTSLVQFELLEKLTANWYPNDGKTLFLVGDPMQSIYRFRKAEVGLFLQAKQQGIGNVILNFVQLRVNFRSTPQIVEWINNAFKHGFPQQDDMIYGAISYMPAEVEKQSSTETLLAVECFVESSQSEIIRIIDIIKITKQENPLKTIAILVRAKSHLKYLLPALRAEKISYQGIELESLKERPLVQDLLALTRAILHLDDRIAWLAILRAPWSGLCLQDLQSFADNYKTIWQMLCQPDILEQLSLDGRLRCETLVKVMNDVLVQRGRLSIDVLVQTAWENLGGMQCLTELGLLQEAEEYFNFLSKIASRREIFSPEFLEQQLQDLFLAPPNVDNNAVQIMTMHKAKGLEFDVVILPSLGKKTRRDTDKLLLIERRNYPDDCLIMAPIKSAYAKQDLIYKYLSWAENLRQDYEELRLLYVAMTRAIGKIYCLCTKDANILPAITINLTNNEQTEIILNDIAPRSISRLASAWYQNNVYKSMQLETKVLQAKPIQQDWMRLVGIVVHRVFYNIVIEGLENWPQPRIFARKPAWEQHLRQLGLSKPNCTQAMQLIKQAIYNTINDPMGIKILSAQYPESYAEWSLSSRYGEEFTQVILDRAFRDHEDIFWLVDYKILHDEAELADAIERYSAQVLKYRRILTQLRPELKIKTGLYFPLQARWCEL